MKYKRFTILALGTLLLLGCGDVITLSPSVCEKPNRKLFLGEIPTSKDLAIDAYCAARIMDKYAPQGFITIFGSARTKPDNERYKVIKEFAKIWTENYSKQYPILTGGGPGIMAAGNEGAKEANGPSLYYSTYFGEGGEKPNHYTTDGFVFASFSQREAEMVDRAAAIIIAPGGFGTEWEIFETLAKIQTNKKKPVPVILLGRFKYWGSLLSRINYLKSIETISPEDTQLLKQVDNSEEAARIVARSLNLASIK